MPRALNQLDKTIRHAYHKKQQKPRKHSLTHQSLRVGRSRAGVGAESARVQLAAETGEGLVTGLELHLQVLSHGHLALQLAA